MKTKREQLLAVQRDLEEVHCTLKGLQGTLKGLQDRLNTCNREVQQELNLTQEKLQIEVRGEDLVVAYGGITFLRIGGTGLASEYFRFKGAQLAYSEWEDAGYPVCNEMKRWRGVEVQITASLCLKVAGYLVYDFEFCQPLDNVQTPLVKAHGKHNCLTLY